MQREPQLHQRGMLSMPTLGGQDQLSYLVDSYGGEARVCKDFRLAPELLRSYLAGVMEVPLTTLLAIYWQGPYGFSHAFTESHWANSANFARANMAEARLVQYRTLLRNLAPSVPGFETLVRAHGIEDMPAITNGVSGS